MDTALAGKDEARRLAREVRDIYVKHGQEILHFEAGKNPIDDGQILAYLVHEDGGLRVPVLVREGLLVRGYTEDLYARVFGRGDR